MDENEMTVTLGNSSISFRKEERIWGVLYKLYHEKIDPLLLRFEEAMQNDIKAVGRLKLESVKATLNTKDKSVDLTPFAADLRHRISDYRSENEYEEPSMVLFDIQEIFEGQGENILKNAFENEKYGLMYINLRERMEAYELKYLKWQWQRWQDEGETSSFEEHIEENKWENFEDINSNMYEQYIGGHIDEVLDSVDDCFGDVEEAYARNHAQLIEEAKKEIEWRLEYMASPKQNRFILEVRRICEKTILDIISCTSQALDLNLNLRYCEWKEYQTCMHKILYMENDAKTDCRTAAIEALYSFPFERSLYKHLYNEFGDADGSITSLAEYLSLDVAGFKSELLNEYVSSMSAIDMNNEDEVKQQLKNIKEKKKFLGCDSSVNRESELQKKLQELDIIKRTVKGKLYRTREEAQNVRDDYQYLECMIKEIDFGSYNLLKQDEISKIEERLLSGDFKSDAFKNDKNYILGELEPVLKYQIQRQKWKNQLCQSTEPWKTVDEIIHSSNILTEYKQKFQYWNFDGLKKFFPKLIQYERPVLYLKMSLLGWSNYFVLTNKRGLHIEKNMQEEIVFNDKTIISYCNGQLMFDNGEKQLSIPMKYPENDIKYFLDILNLIVGTLYECDETLFEMPEGLYQCSDRNSSVQGEISKQIKGVFQGKLSNIFKPVQQSENISEHIEKNIVETIQSENVKCPKCGQSLSTGVKFCNYCGAKIVPMKYCSECGSQIERTAKFCSFCGAKTM
jgi:hypothetical protein